MNLGLGVMAVMAGFEAAAGRMGPGDVTAAVLIMISLYAPLNILGFAYREIRQSFIDMEEMLKVTRQTPQVADAPDARRPAAARRCARRRDRRSRTCRFRHDARANGLEDVSFVARAGHDHGPGRAVGRGQVDDRQAGAAPARSAGRAGC